MNWFKMLFGIGDKMETDIHGLPLPYVKNIVPMPSVKPIKGSNISEPIFAMLSAWKENPKRFVMPSRTTVADLFSGEYDSYHRTPTYTVTVSDKKSSETFEFSLWLENESYKDLYNNYHFALFGFARHKIYPVLGSKVHTKPSWMTQEELVFIIDTVKPYYLKRVNRYRDIVESRIDRARKAGELKSQIAKQKERDRLTGVYK